MHHANTIKPVIIHKAGEEGTMTVDALSGAIVTPLDQRPDWADGLAAALLQERLAFYETRLGKGSNAFKELHAADSIEFSDLGWIGVNEDQDEIEIEASGETRSETIAKHLGINTESGDLGTTLAEIEVDTKRHTMTAAERRVMEEAAASGFSATTAITDGIDKTGTNNA